MEVVNSMRPVAIAFGLSASSILMGGCREGAPADHDGHVQSAFVVVYAALDRGFSEPILAEFTRQTGIDVRPRYDTESTKTVGLTNRIRAEKDRPRCDVFWNNEIVNTLRLKQEGLLERCDPSEAANYPAEFRDTEGYWYGFAARARVLIVNIEMVAEAERPTSIYDLARPEFRGRVGIAKPLFGTTASHVACLFVSLGEEPAKAFLAGLKANDVRILGGNKGCATDVSAGRLAFALTDTDDAIIEVEAGRPVTIVYPDSGADQIGTLLIPNTLALVKGGPNPEGGRKLIEYLLSPGVEEALADGPSAQIPLNRRSKVSPRVCDPKRMKTMKVDFAAAAEAFERATDYVSRDFLD